MLMVLKHLGWMSCWYVKQNSKLFRKDFSFAVITYVEIELLLMAEEKSLI
jgi:hypothetical protein